jgi:hypothetical protein
MTGQRDGLLVPLLADRGAEGDCLPGDRGVQIVELCAGEAAGLLPGVDPEPLVPGQRRDVGRQRDLPLVAVLVFPGARRVLAQELVRAPPQAGQVIRGELVITPMNVPHPGVRDGARQTGETDHRTRLLRHGPAGLAAAHRPPGTLASSACAAASHGRNPEANLASVPARRARSPARRRGLAVSGPPAAQAATARASAE